MSHINMVLFTYTYHISCIWNHRCRHQSTVISIKETQLYSGNKKEHNGEKPLWLKARECPTLIGLLKIFCDHVKGGFKTNLCILTYAHVLYLTLFPN